MVEDETTLRLFPPLRSNWGEEGRAVVVPITGRNAKRVLFGCLNPQTGHRFAIAFASGGKKEFAVFLEEARLKHPGKRIIMLLDRGPAHGQLLSLHSQRVLNITPLWLPKQWPELNCMDQLWRHLKGTVAANRQYADVDRLVAQALAWLYGLSRHEALLKAGLFSKKYWLSKIFKS